MSISQLELEMSRLRVQLAAMPPGTPAYYQVLAQLSHLTAARNGAQQGIRSLNL